MKWIGKHIFDLISRFRSDVYLDSIESSTIVSGGNLGLDSNNKIVKATVSGGGNETTDNSITVTNTDAAFSHLTTIGSGVTFTDVFELILAPYVRSTITLDNIQFAKETSTATMGSSNWVSGNQDVEVGQAFQVTGVEYEVGTPAKTDDNSVIFKVNATTIQGGGTGSNLTDTNTSQQTTTTNVTDDQVVNSTSGDSYRFRVFATDAGDGGSFSPVTITSNSIYVYVKNRFKVGGHATSSVADAAAAKTLWEAIGTGVTGSGLKARGTISVTTDSNMDTEGKYTWIMYPSSWGSISGILQDNSYAVLSDFESPQTLDIENEFGVSTEYKLHRSTYDDAFANGTTLTISF